jgi:hypothetical protein
VAEASAGKKGLILHAERAGINYGDQFRRQQSPPLFGPLYRASHSLFPGDCHRPEPLLPPFVHGYRTVQLYLGSLLIEATGKYRLEDRVEKTRSSLKMKEEKDREELSLGKGQLKEF